MNLHQKSTLKFVPPILLLVFVVSACNYQPNYKTVAGPESKGILEGFTGTLLFDKPKGGLVSLSLPSKTEKFIRKPGKSPGIVHSVSGPDRNDRVAIIENHMTEDRHKLKVYSLSNKNEFVIFDRKGDALWGDEIGDFLALSPLNGYIAMVVNKQGVQLHNPDVYLEYGNLEIWNIKSRQKLPIEQSALDDGLSWFPGGNRLAFVELLDQDTAKKLYHTKSVPKETYGKANLKWRRVPVVSILNVETGKIEHLYVGWRPLVSEEGDAVLMGDYENNWIIISLNDGNKISISPRGIISLGAIYFNQSKIFYWALPTKGTKLRATKNNSPLVGPKPMYALKIAEFDTGRFETIIPYIDPRRDLSFGINLRKNRDN